MRVTSDPASIENQSWGWTVHSFNSEGRISFFVKVCFLLMETCFAIRVASAGASGVQAGCRVCVYGGPHITSRHVTHADKWISWLQSILFSYSNEAAGAGWRGWRGPRAVAIFMWLSKWTMFGRNGRQPLGNHNNIGLRTTQR